jgi:hypothetical protein
MSGVDLKIGVSTHSPATAGGPVPHARNRTDAGSPAHACIHQLF